MRTQLNTLSDAETLVSICAGLAAVLSSSAASALAGVGNGRLGVGRSDLAVATGGATEKLSVDEPRLLSSLATRSVDVLRVNERPAQRDDAAKRRGATTQATVQRRKQTHWDRLPAAAAPCATSEPAEPPAVERRASRATGASTDPFLLVLLFAKAFGVVALEQEELFEVRFAARAPA